MARGSVRKRCQCRDENGRQVKGCRKAHGSWTYTIDTGVDPGTGKRRQVMRSGFRSRDEATEAMTRELAAVDAGLWVDDQGMTVGQWLDRWLAGHGGEIRTVANYRSQIEELWRPKLGHLRLRDLRRHHVEDALRDLAKPIPEDAPGRKGRPVKRSAATIDSYRRTLRAALTPAVDGRMIAVNWAEGRMQAIPRGRASKDLTIWEPEQVAQFLDATAGHELTALFELAAYAGLRRAELCGIRWADIDEDGVTIRQTLGEATRNAIPEDRRACPVCGAEHRGRFFKPAKSEAGDRWVPLVLQAQVALTAHRMIQADDRRKLGPDYSDHDLVFCRVDGTPLRPGDVTDAFRAQVTRLKLPEIRLHDMRHGAASILLAGGVPIEVVQMILGHSSPDVTRRVYRHMLKGHTAKQMGQAAGLIDEHRRRRDG